MAALDLEQNDEYLIEGTGFLLIEEAVTMPPPVDPRPRRQLYQRGLITR